MSRSAERYSSQQLATAKNLYFQHKTATEIEAATGVKKKALQYYITKEWLQERESLRAEMVDTLSKSEEIDLVQVSKYGLAVLKRGLKELAESTDLNPNAHLLKTVSAIVFESQKIQAMKELTSPKKVEAIEPPSDEELLDADPFLTPKEEDEEIIDCTNLNDDPSSSDSSTTDS